jgi:UV DNA damage endonuclease
MRKYGYCCINMTLGEGKKENRITTNRAMVKKTFLERGLGYASETALLNCKDLIKVIKWNNDHGIKMYRMSSDIFPWASEYEFQDLPDFEEIHRTLLEAGDEAKRGGQRITFHPSPYGVLASLREDVVKNAIKDLRQHAEIMDLMGLDQTHYYPINIHVNTTQPTKEEAAQRFCDNFHLLPETVKKRLVVEVDDKKSQFTAVDLYHMVHSKIGIPITFDYLHNLCNPSHLDEKQALALCLSTWPEGIPAIVHYSDSKRKYEDPSAKDVAHSDWLYENIKTYGMGFDIELEVKMKEKALLKYLQDFGTPDGEISGILKV